MYFILLSAFCIHHVFFYIFFFLSALQYMFTVESKKPNSYMSLQTFVFKHFSKKAIDILNNLDDTFYFLK